MFVSDEATSSIQDHLDSKKKPCVILHSKELHKEDNGCPLSSLHDSLELGRLFTKYGNENIGHYLQVCLSRIASLKNTI